MTDETLIGRKLANYRIDRFLGQGGMAQVYYAWDESLDRSAAVKVISSNLRGDVTYAGRFVQESRAISQWRHENILQVYYAGKAEDLYFFAMEYIDGLNLEQILNQYAQRGELIPHDDVIRIGRAIAGALDYAHSKHVIHRDVKPANVMIDKENRVVLADFGLAMDTQRGSLGKTFGTPHYVAPEQAMNSADAVPQSDLYSLGIILYEMLTGVVPFDEPSSMSLALKHVTEPPPSPRTINPSLSRQVEDVLLQALEKDPSKRYPNGAALIDALENALRAQTEAGQAFLSLPPIPAGANSPASLPQSRLSVVDNVRLSAPMPPPQLPVNATPATGKQATNDSATPVAVASSRHTTSRKSPGQLLGLGAVGIVLFLILAIASFLLLPEMEETPTEPTEVSQTDTLEETAVQPTQPQPVATETPAETATAQTIPETAVTTIPVAANATDAPTPVATETLSTPTNEPTPEPTTAALVEAPAQAEPTIAYPDGRPLELAYDTHSFYLYNPSSERIRVKNISFEALDNAGRPLRYGMAGNRWTQFHSFIEGYACYSIEPFGVGGVYMRPPHCRDYNASVTPAKDGDEIFWTERGGAIEFRVLWADQEIARCPLGTNTCTVFVPTP